MSNMEMPGGAGQATETPPAATSPETSAESEKSIDEMFAEASDKIAEANDKEAEPEETEAPAPEPEKAKTEAAEPEKPQYSDEELKTWAESQGMEIKPKAQEYQFSPAIIGQMAQHFKQQYDAAIEPEAEKIYGKYAGLIDWSILDKEEQQAKAMELSERARAEAAETLKARFDEKFNGALNQEMGRRMESHPLKNEMSDWGDFMDEGLKEFSDSTGIPLQQLEQFRLHPFQREILALKADRIHKKASAEAGLAKAKEAEKAEREKASGIIPPGKPITERSNLSDKQRKFASAFGMSEDDYALEHSKLRGRRK